MNAKITLYSEKELIDEIKKYAKKNKTSVSKLVNDFFKSLLEKDKITITDSLSGMLKDKNVSTDDYYLHLEKKYL
ncbi:MAG: hypothetical protein GXO62_00795 [Epsilonproteobacteria bacterium]|nr:hypothetical protein [Campylobacterota bacterium]